MVHAAEQPKAPKAPEQAQSCMCELYARATERAALASARWLGQGDQESAEEAAFSGMQRALETLPMSGRIVIGATEGSEVLAIGHDVGAGGDEVDLALDPLEGRGVVARGGSGAMAMIISVAVLAVALIAGSSFAAQAGDMLHVGPDWLRPILQHHLKPRSHHIQRA